MANTPSRDPMARITSVPATKALEASEIFQGFLGSWAAEFTVNHGMMDDASTPDGVIPSTPRTITTHLGQPGYPEVNFVPFAAGTNRFGPKGGSLIGCPISFSIVGPTLKRGGRVNWQWKVTDNSSGAGGDTLELDDFVITDWAIPTLTAIVGGVPERYNVGTTFSMDCPDGLYLAISHTGSPGLVDNGADVPGGVGDGSIWQWPADAGNTRYGLTPTKPESKYEIFRVIDISGKILTLDPSKRLVDYFTFTAAAPGVINSVRGVTLFEPKATRLVAVANSGVSKGLEQTFVAVPPNRAANDDQQYPFIGQPANDGWHDTAFTEEGWTMTINGQTDTDSAFEYRNPPQLPVSKPIGQATFRLYGEMGETPVDVGPGRTVIALDSIPEWGLAERTIGNILHIYNVRRIGDAQLKADSDGNSPDLDSLLGWFEIVREINSGVTASVIRRIDDVDPLTGRPFYGTAKLLATNPTLLGAGERIQLEAEVHNPISSLWTSNFYDSDAVDSARLTNLIDPNWTGRSSKGKGNGLFDRADRAIFDTRTSGHGAAGTNANPGSLLDLGFRMVFFPAKTRQIVVPNPTTTGWPGAGWGDPQHTVSVLVPDFDHPIDSTEVLLDSIKPNERQFIEVDYSNGLIQLSHSIKVGSPLYSADVFSNPTDNPRGEMVIFASCVPYSREPGQLGAGIRVMGGSPVNELDVPCAEQGTEYASSDVYGSRIAYPIIAQTVDSSREVPGNVLTLSGSHLREIPSSGFVEVLTGASPDGDPVFYSTKYRGSLFGYYAVEESGADTHLYGRFGGGVTGTDSHTFVAEEGVAVLRRDVTLPSTNTGVAGTPYQYDTTYGYAKRSGTVRFGDSDLHHNADGSISVKPKSTIAKSIQDTLGVVFTTTVLEGGEVSVTDAGINVTVTTTAMTYLLEGENRQVPVQTLMVAKAVTAEIVYIYWDSAACTLANSPALPLFNPITGVLLARVDVPSVGGAGTLSVMDLRYPLNHLDARTDILVGNNDKYSEKACFPTLAQAVAYASELMNPQGAGPNGSADTIRIRVVGPTTETETPILIKTDGLTIEGTGLKHDTCVITWAGEHPLFDFNGHHHLTFRSLYAENSSTHQAGALITGTGSVSLLSESMYVYTTEATADPYITLAVGPGTFGILKSGAGTAQLTATTFNAANPDPLGYTWYTSDASIATVSVTGLVTSAAGGGTGPVIITAEGNTTKAAGSFQVWVYDPALPASVIVGGQFIVRDGGLATVRGQAVGVGAADVNFNWTSDHPVAVSVPVAVTPTTAASGYAESPRVMFTNTGGVSYDLAIDHCYFSHTTGNPYADGFLYVRSPSGINDSRITDNLCTTTEFGACVLGSNSNLIFEGNYFSHQVLSTPPSFVYRIPNFGGGIALGDTNFHHVTNNTINGYSFQTPYPLSGTSYDVYTGDYSWVQNNEVVGNTGYMHIGDATNLASNLLQGTTGDCGLITGDNCKITDNTITSATSSALVTLGQGCLFQGNTLDGLIVGSSNRVLGNTISKAIIGGVGGSLTDLIISGNSIGSDTGTSVVITSFTGCIEGNDLAGIIEVFGGEYTVSNNQVGGGLMLAGKITVSGNRVATASTFNGTPVATVLQPIVIQGNTFGDDVTFPDSGTATFLDGSTRVNFEANHVAGDLIMTGAQDHHSIVGNQVTQNVNANVKDSAIQGNTCAGDLKIGVTVGVSLLRCNCAVVGNRVSGDLEVGIGSTISSNSVHGDLTFYGSGVVSGNDVVGGSGIIISPDAAPKGGTDVVITGNTVLNDINLGAGGTGCSIEGNKIGGSILPGAPGGDPDSGANGGTLVVGNWLGTGERLFGGVAVNKTFGIVASRQDFNRET